MTVITERYYRNDTDQSFGIEYLQYEDTTDEIITVFEAIGTWTAGDDYNTYQSTTPSGYTIYADFATYEAARAPVLQAEKERRNNFEATTTPTATDDSDKRYGIGSVWVDETANTIYQCTNATPGAAIWPKITSDTTPPIPQAPEFIVASSTSVANLNSTSISQIVVNVEDFADTNWSLSANFLNYTGSPKLVKISIDMGVTGTLTRGNLIIKIRRNGLNIGGTAKSGYIRNNSGHNEASYNLFVIDPNPGTNPVYSFHTQREAGAGTITMTAAQNQFSAEAISA